MIGSSSKDVIGGAGQTVLALNKITKSLTMADGPAGIRLRSEYGIDEKGNTYTTKLDPIFSKMLDVLPKFIHPFIKPKKKRNGKSYINIQQLYPLQPQLLKVLMMILFILVAISLNKRWKSLMSIFG